MSTQLEGLWCSDLPAIGGLAQFALGSVLAALQIGMAVLALVRSVGESEVVVAVAAAHGSMTAAKGESSVRMIEPDPVREELPVRGCVQVTQGMLRSPCGLCVEATRRVDPALAALHATRNAAPRSMNGR